MTLSDVATGVEWLSKVALPWAAFGYGIYWLRRFRTQELVRNQMQLGTEIVKVLFAIEDATRRWMGGSVSAWNVERDKLLPELVSTLARAKLLLPPVVAERLDLVSDHLSQISGQLFLAQHSGLPHTEAFEPFERAARHQARRALPAKILAETSAVMTELHKLFHPPEFAAEWAAKREAALVVELQQMSALPNQEHRD